MNTVPYRLHRPEKCTSFVVFASPHSGANYPEKMQESSLLSPLALRSSEDAYVNEFFESTVDHGAFFLEATLPRAWVDLNRRSDELDPALICGVKSKNLNPRVLSGLGVIPRVVANGQAIYSGKISRAEADERVQTVWEPYHKVLGDVLAETRAMFGRALLIDCHSMPREALGGARTGGGRQPQIVIGDRFGGSARPAYTQMIEQAFKAEGFDVARNAPFAGAFITQHYGKPFQNQSAVQVEIDRSLYMDEKTLEPHAGFADVKAALERTSQRIMRFGAAESSVAAE